MKYICKQIVDGCGDTNECWLARRGFFDVKTANALLYFEGWKSKDSMLSDADKADVNDTAVPLASLQAFQPLLMELIGLITGPVGALSGGTIDAEGSIYCSVMSPCDHVATYWRHATGSFDLVSDTGLISLKGWRDKAAYDAGLDMRMSATQNVSSLAALSTFEAAWGEISLWLISQGSGTVFENGTIKETGE